MSSEKSFAVVQLSSFDGKEDIQSFRFKKIVNF